MLRNISFCLAILAAFSVNLAAQSEEEQILSCVEGTYKNLKSFKLSGGIEIQMTGGQEKPTEFQDSFLMIRGETGLLVRRSSGFDKILAVTDGSSSSILIAPKKVFLREQTPNLEGFISSKFRIENASFIFPSIALLEKYSALKTKFHDPKLAGNEDLPLDGKTIHCVIIEGVMDLSEIDAPWKNRKTLLWIDKEKMVVLKESSIGFLGDDSGKRTARQTITFNAIQLNEPQLASAFSFIPPNGTEEVKELYQYRSSAQNKADSINQVPPILYAPQFVGMRNFMLPSVSGELFNLAQHRGKVVVLDFWATWCTLCHAQMNDLAKLLRKYGDKDLVVVGLNAEDERLTREFVKEKPSSFPLLLDVMDDVNIAHLFGVDDLPTLVVLDRAGNVIAKKVGKLPAKDIEALLKQAGL